MRRHYKYLSYVLRHKWLVLLFGLRLRVPIHQLIIHDWTKFLPGEWFAYAATFYKPNGEKQYEPTLAFSLAWNRHEKKHPHHWQYWVLIMDSGELKPQPMPNRYRREMLADWKAAGRALGKPDTRAWYLANSEHIMLHPVTRAWVEAQLGIIPDEFREALSDLQHTIWSSWMLWLFHVSEKNEDGTVLIPADKVKRWMRQIDTVYPDLTEQEKDSDREQADKVIALLYGVGD